jgi:hypothetical protein
MALDDDFWTRDLQRSKQKKVDDAWKRGNTAEALGHVSNDLALKYLQSKENYSDDDLGFGDDYYNRTFNDYVESRNDDNEINRTKEMQKASVRMLLDLLLRKSLQLSLILPYPPINEELVNEASSVLEKEFKFGRSRTIIEQLTFEEEKVEEELDRLKVDTVRAILREPNMTLISKIYLAVEVSDVHTTVFASKGWAQCKFLSCDPKNSGYLFLNELETLGERIKYYKERGITY